MNLVEELNESSVGQSGEAGDPEDRAGDKVLLENIVPLLVRVLRKVLAEDKAGDDQNGAKGRENKSHGKRLHFIMLYKNLRKIYDSLCISPRFIYKPSNHPYNQYKKCRQHDHLYVNK